MSHRTDRPIRNPSDGSEIQRVHERLERLERVAILPGALSTFANVDDLNAVEQGVSSLTNQVAGLSTSPAAGFPARVTTLPTTGVSDGFEVVYVPPTGGTGIEFRLKYATAESLYKWRYNGGSELMASVPGARNENLASSSYSPQIAQGTPSLPIPLEGDYIFEWGCRVYVSSSTYFGQLDVALGVSSSFTFAMSVGGGLAGFGASGGTTTGYIGTIYGKTRLTVSAGFSWQMWVSGNLAGPGQFTTYDRWISARPIRVI